MATAWLLARYANPRRSRRGQDHPVARSCQPGERPGPPPGERGEALVPGVHTRHRGIHPVAGGGNRAAESRPSQHRSGDALPQRRGPQLPARLLGQPVVHQLPGLVLGARRALPRLPGHRGAAGEARSSGQASELPGMGQALVAVLEHPHEPLRRHRGHGADTGYCPSQ